ncbi:MAG: hypothetical protein ACE5K7_01350 [Phycisphaerae bacterium]
MKVEPRSSTAIAAGLSSYPDLSQKMHHQSFGVTRGVTDPKKARKKMRPKDRPLENDFISDEEFDRLLLAWFGQIARVPLPGRSFYIWGDYANLGNYPAALKECELYFSQGVVWDKQHPVLTRKDYMGCFELAFYGWREGAGHITRPSVCEECGATDRKIEAAHYDYDEPLRVRWLCRSCHVRWDRREPKGATFVVCEEKDAQRWQGFTGRKAKRLPAGQAGTPAGKPAEMAE